MFLILFLFWILLNGKITVEIVLFGAAISAALTFAAYRVLHTDPRKEWLLFCRLPGVFAYLFYLVWQMVLSNLQVIALILRPGSGRPKLVWFRPALKGDGARLALANSVTLTPGTVTAALGKKTICVYALRPHLAEGLAECGFVKKLRRLEGEKHG